MERRKEGERRWREGKKESGDGGGRERKGVNEVDEQGGLVHVEEKEEGLRSREGGRGIEAKEEGVGEGGHRRRERKCHSAKTGSFMIVI